MPKLDKELPPELELSIANFHLLAGASLKERLDPWEHWLTARREAEVWPFSRIVESVPREIVQASRESGHGERTCLNFASQDYLNLSTHPQVVASAIEACHRYGLHSAGSAISSGRTRGMVDLENILAATLKMEACMVFSTGWSAGFGMMVGLVREHDAIIADKLIHSCLKEGCAHTKTRLSYFAHNDVNQLEALLKTRRAQDADRAIFVVIESLYSMDSDSPTSDIFTVARRYGAIVVLDVAHDFGAMGANGMGLLETLPDELWPDVIMGSFSKTFASNGGFVATKKSAVDYLRVFAPSFTFSNALSPLQASVVKKAHEIVFSNEGHSLRQQLMANVELFRQRVTESGLVVGGIPSPIVPVFLGEDVVARLSWKMLEARNVLANLAEYPGVPLGQARFRFQLMARHSDADIEQAVFALSDACSEAHLELTSGFQSEISK